MLSKSKVRTATGVALFAAIVLAVAGHVVANAFDDETPPYEDSAISTVAWDCFLVFGAVSIALVLLHLVWLVLDRSRR